MAETVDSGLATPLRKSVAGLITFFGLLVIGGMVAMPIVAGESTENSLNQWGHFLGRLHPVVLHLPIGMFTLLLILEFGKLFRKNKGSSTLVPLFFTAASSVVAVIFGFLLHHGRPGEYDADLVESHQWWGIGFAGATVAALILKSWIEVAGGAGNWTYLLTLLSVGGVMTVASHDGGSLTHGKTFLTDEAPNEVRRVLNLIPGNEPLPLLEEDDDSESLDGTESESEIEIIPFNEQVVYEQIIHPIFVQKCISCHGEEKQKGRLRMDSYEALVEGGKEGSALTPGDADDSNLVFRIHLPEDDDEHMPPEGKPQIEAHELVLLEWWINNGASPTAKSGELEVSEQVIKAVNQLVPPELREAQRKAEEAAEAQQLNDRNAATAQVELLAKEFPAAISFETGSSSDLVFTAVNHRNDFGDEELGRLAPVINQVVSLDLSGTKVSDEGIKILENAANLETIKLSGTEISDQSIPILVSILNLKSLNLYDTAVTNEGVSELSVMPNLRRIYLWQTQVDEQGAETLRAQMPNTEVVLGL